MARCVSKLDSLNLKVDIFDLLPHYSKFLSRFDKFEEKCCAYEKERNVSVIRINDGEGVFIDSEVNIYKV